MRRRLLHGAQTVCAAAAYVSALALLAGLYLVTRRRRLG